MEAKIRDFMIVNIMSEERLRHIVADTDAHGMHPANGWIYDAELGFKHAKTRHIGDGVGGSDTFYGYEEDGCRRLLNFADSPCRLHTYGDSFTHCDQVNDDETWQERLAAEFQEPIRNYGVGGYSVYQAYLRMRKMHEEGARPEYVILNIIDDDHYRNLISWIRRTGTGFTRPHLRVNVSADSYVECANPIPSANDLSNMRDLDFLQKTFGEDALLYLAMAMASQGEQAQGYLQGACERFGVGMPANAHDMEAATEAVFTEAALFSTRKIVQMVEDFCDENGIALMYILSFIARTLRSILAGTDRFDRELATWLRERGRPLVDMCDCFSREFENSQEDLDAFIERYYVGQHHSPCGNTFTARAITETVVGWLDPKPVPYQYSGRSGPNKEVT